MAIRLLLPAFFFCVALALDSTQTPQAYDTPVVLATVRKIEESCIFANDFQFLRRIAWQESLDGRMLPSIWTTFKGKGGIWQIDPIALQDVQNRSTTAMNQKKAQISAQYGIDINALNRDNSDLEIPINAGIVARLKLFTIAAPIPMNINAQAAYWKTYYNTAAGSGTVEQFLANMQKIPPCNARGADLLFILDSSGSIGSSTFTNVRTFVQTVIQGLNIDPDANQVGIIDFSDSAVTVISFNSSKSALMAAAGSMKYYGSGTATTLALNQAVINFNAARDPSSGFPRVAVLVTDGQPNDPPSASAAAEALKASGITLFTVGVTSGADNTDLPNMASNPSCLYYYSLASYAELASEFPDILNSRTCDTSAAAPSNSSAISASVAQGQSLPFRFPVNITQGITFKLAMSSGQATIYASTKTRLPSSAEYEFMATASVGQLGQIYIPPNDMHLNDSSYAFNRLLSDYAAADSTSGTVTVFASVTGTAANTNNFTLQFNDGDTREKGAASALCFMPALLFLYALIMFVL